MHGRRSRGRAQNPKPVPLLLLPDKILGMIISYLAPQDLKFICLVKKRILSLARPMLFSSFPVSRQGSETECASVRAVIDLLKQDTALAHSVTRLLCRTGHQNATLKPKVIHRLPNVRDLVMVLSDEEFRSYTGAQGYDEWELGHFLYIDSDGEERYTQGVLEDHNDCLPGGSGHR